MSEYTEPDICLRCDSPTSLCQCPKSVLDWHEYTEILLAENETIKAEFKETLACRHARIDELAADNSLKNAVVEAAEGLMTSRSIEWDDRIDALKAALERVLGRREP